MDVDRKWVYRIGGVASVVLGVTYLSIIPLFGYAGSLPNGGEAALKYLVGKTTVWSAIVGLNVVADLLYVPLGLALYFVLREINRIAMLVATAFIAIFIVVDLAVTWTNYAALIVLSGGYAATTDAVQRQAYVAAASYASAALTSRVEIAYSISDLSLAILLIGYVMLKGSFGRPAAYLGLLTGVLGILALSASTVVIIANAICATVWVLLVGYGLLRLSVQPRPVVPQVR